MSRTGKSPAISSVSEEAAISSDQSQAPIFDALAQYRQSGSVSFGVPGHKSGKGAPDDIKQVLDSLLPPVDKAVLTGELAAHAKKNIEVGLANGVAGWRDDDLAFTRPWGFELAEIGQLGADIGKMPFRDLLDLGARSLSGRRQGEERSDFRDAEPELARPTLGEDKGDQRQRRACDEAE